MLHGGGGGGVRGVVCVRRTEKKGKGRGGRVKPTAVAMATTSSCCRSIGSWWDDRVSLKLRGGEEGGPVHRRGQIQSQWRHAVHCGYEVKAHRGCDLSAFGYERRRLWGGGVKGDSREKRQKGRDGRGLLLYGSACRRVCSHPITKQLFIMHIK